MNKHQTITPPGLRKALILMLAPMLALTVSMPSTAQAADADVNELIVNGDFEYPGAAMLGMQPDSQSGTLHGKDWAGVDRAGREYFSAGAGANWKPLPSGFDPSKFGWDSTETDGPDNSGIGQRHANEVELQLDLDGNIYAELAASQEHTSIYQRIRTVKGVAYHVRLDHTSLYGLDANPTPDSMRVVMKAKDGSETVIPMTRVTSNGHGDKVGETSDTVTTRATNNNSRDHKGQWETYEGTYIATSDETTFMFQSMIASTNLGNLLDNISFTKAYPLSYDLNGGSGTLPNRQ